MFETFTPRVEQVIKIARELARDGDQEYLGTEHVVLGICREGTGLGAKLLETFSITEAKLHEQIAQRVRKSMEETWVFGQLPGSPNLKSAVARAVELAREFNCTKVCTEHLLLSILKEKGSIAERCLNSLGLTFDRAHIALTKLTAQTDDGG